VTESLGKKPEAPGHHPTHKAAKIKESTFIDGVYSSASGNMPSEYTAWTPDGGASTASEHAKRLAETATAGSPTKSMLAILDDDDNDALSPNPEQKPGLVSSQPHVEKGKGRPGAGSHASGSLVDHGSVPEASETVAEEVSKATSDGLPATDAEVNAGGPQEEHVSKHALKEPVHASKAADTDVSEALPAAKETSHAATGAQAEEDVATTSAPEAKEATPSPPGPQAEVPDLAAAAFEPEEAPPVPEAKPGAVVKPGSPATEKMSKHLDSADDEAVDQASPARESANVAASTPAQQLSSQRTLAHGSLVQKGHQGQQKQDQLAEGSNLPTQYDAWTPSDSQPTKKDTSLEQMVAEFKSDDDDDGDESTAPTPAPARRLRSKRRGALAARAKAHAPSPAPLQSGDTGVIYDDDDLPRHHHRSISAELEGGWKSFMHKGAAAKAHKPKLDPDVAIMNSLYANDGGLPKQYTAWQPSAADGQASPPGIGADLKAAAKELESPLAFAQVSALTLGAGSVARLIQHAAVGDTSTVPTVLLQEVAVVANATRIAAANIVLDQYAQVLRSQTLQQLANAKLSPPKLAALWERLQQVDPLTNPGAVAVPERRQAQAEQLCQYFEKNEQSAAPAHQAVVQLEKASNQLAESVSQRAALAEEVDARTQLQRTVEQDVQSLSGLLNATQQELTSLSSEDLPALWPSGIGVARELMNLGAATEAVQAEHTELVDLLEAMQQRRVRVLEAQRVKVAQLHTAMGAADKTVAEKKALVTRSHEGIEAARQRLAGIRASCSATLGALGRRRHAGHMEAHAVEVALQVLRGP